eukprot:12409013-Karenia_brevis.AAC.1
MAWMLLSKSVAHVHTYDARLIPRETLSAVSEPVSTKLCEVAQSLCGGGFDRHARELLRLGGAYAGVGIRPTAVGLQADACFYSGWCGVSVLVPDMAQKL